MQNTLRFMQNYKLYLALFALVGGSALVGHAQTPVVRAGVEAITSSATKQVAQRGALSVLEEQTARQTALGAAQRVYVRPEIDVVSMQANVLSATSASAAEKRPWFTQQQRNFKAWQLKWQRKRAAQQNSQITAAEKELTSLVQLQTEQSFSADEFASWADSVQAPDFVPFIEHPLYLYRGLGLPADGLAVRRILEKGLLLEDTGADASNLLAAISSPRGAMAASRMKMTNLTTIPSTAAMYAQRNTTKGRVAIIVKVKGISERSQVVRVYEDIPPAQIEEVIALLNINGQSTWCRVELGETGALKITPYRQISQEEICASTQGSCSSTVFIEE